jgi:tRNA 2-thiouridine synthesizing protein A
MREGAVDGRPRIRTLHAMTTIKLDLSGLKCPLPALKTRKALKCLLPGDRLEVHCTDPLAMIDIPHLVGVVGDHLESIEHGEGDTVFRIEKSARTLESKPPPN